MLRYLIDDNGLRGEFAHYGLYEPHIHFIQELILGGPSEVLDLGRSRRFFSRPQRVAMVLRDGCCTAVGCDAPPGMCDSHHEDLWSHDGTTDLGRGRLLCGHHHRRAHDPAYETRVVERNQVEFHRRT